MIVDGVKDGRHLGHRGYGKVPDRITHTGDFGTELGCQVMVRDKGLACPVCLVLFHQVDEGADARDHERLELQLAFVGVGITRVGPGQ